MAQQMMNNPMMQQQMDMILNNPQMLEQIMQNPMFKAQIDQMTGGNPML